MASAIASRNLAFTRALEAAAAEHLDAAHLQAARSAAAIMGMNNIYYRFLHLVEDAEYQAMPARLRMNILANPGIDKLDFELLSLAVSAVNGCGLCISSHEKKLRAHGYTREMIQSAVRIAADGAWGSRRARVQRGSGCNGDRRPGGVRAEKGGAWVFASWSSVAAGKLARHWCGPCSLLPRARKS